MSVFISPLRWQWVEPLLTSLPCCMQVPQAASGREDPLCRALPAGETLLRCTHCPHVAVGTFRNCGLVLIR